MHSDESPKQRRGFFIAPLLLLLIFTDAHASSATLKPVIQGQIIDTENRVVPYTSITFQQSAMAILSDEYGYFSCMIPLQSTDTMIIRRIGYKEQHLPLLEFSRSEPIILEPASISLDEVKVEANASPVRSLVLPLMHKHTKPASSTGSSHANIISRIPGLTLKSYGGPAGIATLGMDGGPSSQTLVYLNGISLTSPQNGETDLSQIPEPFIQSILYIPSDISQNTTGSSDGILKLESDPNGNQVSIAGGSYGHRSADLNLSTHLFGSLISVQVGKRKDSGNYLVQWQGEAFERENNGFEQEYAAISFLHLISQNLFWKLSALESRQSRGVAGLIWSPDTLSHRRDHLRLLGSKLGWTRPQGVTDLNISSRYSFENYENPFLNLDAEHELSSRRIAIQDRSRFTPAFKLITDLSLRNDRISSTDTGDRSRTTVSAALTPVIGHRSIRVSPALKHYYSPSLFNKTSGDIQVQINPGSQTFQQVALGYHEVFRYPSFNDLYWQPGGNPDLAPEKTRVGTAQLLTDLSVFGKLRFQWQSKVSRDLIQWIPSQAYWAPQNIKSTSRQSAKLSWSLEISSYDLSAYASLAFIKTNDAATNKPLRYAPKQTRALGLSWTPHPIEAEMNYRYLGERISMYDFPADNILPGTSTWFASLTYIHALDPGSVSLSLSVDNLSDVQYETIRGYPEPGRTFRMSIKYNWNQ